MRLAFAVAAHLEPEILVIDEVLAVGDAAFQHKCLGKMDSVARHGRTVLFVSHNMQAVGALCQRVMLLYDGRLMADGAASSVVSRHLAGLLPEVHEVRWSEDEAPGDNDLRLVAVRVRSGGPMGTAYLTSEDVWVDLEFIARKSFDHSLCVGF